MFNLFIKHKKIMYYNYKELKGDPEREACILYI